MAHEHVHDENCRHGDHEDEGIDLLRLQLVGEHMHCSLDPAVFKDEPGTWGVVLADIARNLSESMTEDPASQRRLLDEIRANFQKALEGAAEE